MYCSKTSCKVNSSFGRIALEIYDQISITVSISASMRCGFDNSDIPKNRVSETSKAIAPVSIANGTENPPNLLAIFMPKLMAMLEMIATLAAIGVARFQLRPTAIVGTSAAAKVPHPNAPNRATRSPM